MIRFYADIFLNNVIVQAEILVRMLQILRNVITD